MLELLAYDVGLVCPVGIGGALLGTLGGLILADVALLLPFAISILVVWFLFFLLWWSLGIPLGPGAPAA